jgi:chaperonin GroEL
MQERLAKLAGGVAILNIGAETEIELKEKKDRVDDALHATRAALEEGILPGGGIALYKISKLIQESPATTSTSMTKDNQIGYNIVLDSIKKPFMKLISNAGYNDYDVIPDLKNTEFQIGHDIRNNIKVDMYEAGIIDPTKVIKTALQKAASAAGMLLTTEAVITNIIDKNKKEDQYEQTGF